MSYEPPQAIRVSDLAFFDVRHEEYPLVGENENYIDVIEIKSPVYHQQQIDAYYKTVCGISQHDGILVKKELAAKLLPPCVDGCWQPEEVEIRPAETEMVSA